MKSMNHKFLKLSSQRDHCITKMVMDPSIIFVGTHTKKDMTFSVCISSMSIEYLIDAQEDNLSLSHLGFKCDPKYVYFS